MHTGAGNSKVAVADTRSFQFATAGWKYTPTPEYEDTTTCIYCHLALDCWDPNDSPL